MRRDIDVFSTAVFIGNNYCGCRWGFRMPINWILSSSCFWTNRETGVESTDSPTCHVTDEASVGNAVGMLPTLSPLGEIIHLVTETACGWLHGWVGHRKEGGSPDLWTKLGMWGDNNIPLKVLFQKIRFRMIYNQDLICSLTAVFHISLEERNAHRTKRFSHVCFIKSKL